MLPALICLAAVVGLLVAERNDSAVARAAFKLTAASCFVWAAVGWGAFDSAYGQIVLLGLVLCWFGDALLLPAGQTIWFQLGIAAFLLGHVAYGVAFARLFPAAGTLLGVGVAMAIVAVVVLRWLRPHVPADFRIAVVAYGVVIAGMVAVALSATASGAPLAIALGAVGFALSDLSVARDRFVSPGFVNGAWGLPAYFVSQLVLAYSVQFV